MTFVKSNGTSTPHATNYSDLLDKVIAFALATGGWQIVNDQLTANGTIYLKGLDYSGDKDIYIGIRKYAAVGADIYGWQLQGYTGYTGAGFFNNPSAIGGQIPVLPLWNDTIPYWLAVNPRRIILVAKISTVYVAMYMGLMLPYGSPGQWSYPLVVAGSNVATDNIGTMERYSDTDNSMTAPFIPQGAGNVSNFCLRAPTGQWIRIFVSSGSIVPPGGGQQIYTTHGISPYCDIFALFGSFSGGVNNNIRYIRPNLDGKYPLKPLRVMRADTPDALGILDGVQFTTGYNLSTEDTITDGGDTYHAFQDTFRTDLFRFYALKGE